MAIPISAENPGHCHVTGDNEEIFAAYKQGGLEAFKERADSMWQAMR